MRIRTKQFLKFKKMWSYIFFSYLIMLTSALVFPYEDTYNVALRKSLLKGVAFADVIDNITRVNMVLEELIRNYVKLQEIYISQKTFEMSSSDTEVDEVFKYHKKKMNRASEGSTNSYRQFGTQMFVSDEESKETNTDDDNNDADKLRHSLRTVNVIRPRQIQEYNLNSFDETIEVDKATEATARQSTSSESGLSIKSNEVFRTDLSDEDADENSVTKELKSMILRKSYGDACTKVRVKKCYMALKSVLKKTCKSYRCKGKFKESFTYNAKQECIGEFWSGLGKKPHALSGSGTNATRQGDDILKLSDMTRTGKLEADCVKETNRQFLRVPHTKGLLNLNILRDKYERRCQKESRDKCRRACKSSLKAACKTSECAKSMRKDFEKGCKKECKKYSNKRARSSSSGSSSSEGSSIRSESRSESASSDKNKKKYKKDRKDRYKKVKRMESDGNNESEFKEEKQHKKKSRLHRHGHIDLTRTPAEGLEIRKSLSSQGSGLGNSGIIFSLDSLLG